MEYAVTESEINLLSPEAEAVSRVLMSRYGQILICVHMAVYTGIVIAGSILLWTDGTVDQTASATVWLFQGATGLLMGRELVPIVWYWMKTLRKRKTTAVESNLASYMGGSLPEFKYTPVKPRDRKGHVYLIQSPTGAYKIGRTTDPADRLRTFNVKLPFEVEYVCVIATDDMYALERQLHSKFAAKRVNGEWFILSPDDVEYIKGLST